jgi:hypothetical protein
MCATLRGRGETVLLRSYDIPKNAAPFTDEGQAIMETGGIEEISIKTAVRATSAAPFYFPPVEMVKGVEFWDGGLLNNNPVDQIWRARMDLVEGDAPLPKVNCVLSLGTSWCDKSAVPGLLDGHPTIKALLEWAAAAHWYTPNAMSKAASSLVAALTPISELIPFLTNTESKHVDFARYIKRVRNRKSDSEGAGTNYFRFNVPTTKTYIDMSDHTKMQTLKAITETWLKDQDAWVDKVANLLAKKKAI